MRAWPGGGAVTCGAGEIAQAFADSINIKLATSIQSRNDKSEPIVVGLVLSISAPRRVRAAAIVLVPDPAVRHDPPARCQPAESDSIVAAGEEEPKAKENRDGKDFPI